jgi:tetraacyldisaccharide 4'-kinase
MKYLRWLLLPFSLLYGLVVIIRNFFYDAGLFKSQKFSKPVISVGNLEVGGAGKSPMTEYLIRLLKNDYKLATLSRGYGRKTKGYLLENREPRVKNQEEEKNNSGLLTQDLRLSERIGDEPAQFKQKFPDITVAVCEDRVYGINQLLANHDLILMDDAYQHRAVEPGLSILLFDYNRVNEPHFLLPAGNFREPFSGRWRAQVIIVTKCPSTITHDEQVRTAHRISPLPYQSLFFSSIAYQPLQDLNGNRTTVAIDKDTTVFLLTGIANPKPLHQYLEAEAVHIIHHNYPDHHPFTLKNIAKLAEEFEACPAQKKIIVTTEKDAQRFEESWLTAAAQNKSPLPVFVIPISVEFLNDTGASFDKIITDYVREHTTNHSIH